MRGAAVANVWRQTTVTWLKTDTCNESLVVAFEDHSPGSAIVPTDDSMVAWTAGFLSG